jgi:hypothetical protein
MDWRRFAVSAVVITVLFGIVVATATSKTLR